MKRLSTFLCVLALLLVGASSAKAEKVYEIDYSDYTEFPFYVMGFTPEWVGGIMTDNGTGWHQYYIANEIPTVVGNNYKVKALVKATDNITFNVDMRWSWSGDYQCTSTNVTVPKSDEFVEVEWSYRNIGGTSCGLIAQPNHTKKIEWKSLSVYVNDSPVYVKVYGDLREVTPEIWVKENNGSTAVATADGAGVYTVNNNLDSGDDYLTQFWIGTPEDGLQTGQKYYVSFKCKADVEAKIATQTHANNPGGYIHWAAIGDVEFKTDDWHSFEKEVTIDESMNGWKYIAFNMNKHVDNNYYFKDIVLKVNDYIGDIVEFTVTSAGWSTFSCAKAISMGTTNGYAVKAHGTYVELIPVTQVPANNAVLIEGAGKHTFDVVTSAAAIAENDLQISDGSVAGDGSTIFALGKKGDEVGFMKVKNGTKIPAGKAYIVIAGGSAREFIGFGENETTGIEAVQQNAKADNQYFNLAGQRVAQPTKGLYIVNGKKVVLH